MPTYHGLEKLELVRSIKDALGLLESVGPECQKYINKIRAVQTTGHSQLDLIETATSDIALAKAVNSTLIDWLLMRTVEIFDFHALENTNNNGIDIVKRLHQWGAFYGAMTLEYNRIDAEGDSWLAMAYARKISPTNENLEKITQVSTHLSNDKHVLAVVVSTVNRLIEVGAAGGNDEDMKQLFLKLNLYERNVTKDTLYTLFLNGRAKPEFQSFMKGFGVVIDGLKEERVKADDSSVKAVCKKIEEVLEPFRLTDMNKTGIGPGIGCINLHDFQQSTRGMCFYSTLRVAQAVADAFPDMKVIDSEYQIIVSNASSNSIPANDQDKSTGPLVSKLLSKK